MNQGAHVHELSGFLPLIRIGPVEIPTYFLIVSLQFCICLLWLVRRAEKAKLPRVIAIDLALTLMISGFIGARLFHVLFEEPAYYLESPVRILEFWQGGFVWYGGALIGTLACYVFARRKSLNFAQWLDLFAPLGALGYALGRVACLFTGCCYGMVCTLSSGAQFRFPTQGLAIVWELGVLAILLTLEKRRAKRPVPPWLSEKGQIFLAWLVLHATGRILMEIFRADPRGPAPLGLSLSIWLSSLLLISSLWLFQKRIKRKAR